MKITIISILVAVVLVGGAFILTKGKSEPNADTTPVNNVSMVDGKQIITINAKGGYQPSKSIAKAGIPTIIRFDTKGTFDCSSSIRIPSMNITKVLPQTGTTDIDIGTPQMATLQGTCGMGMYPFEITFQG
jgi:plastocyanin domain-containing protein